MKNVKIQGLFPVPIYMSEINRNFTKQELKFVDDQKHYCNDNVGNTNTKDSYILNREELVDIKKFLNDSCEDYLQKIICPKDKIKLCITQSWLNYTEQNQFHHQHTHSNSFVSGVLYLQCNKESDKILFTNLKDYQQIKPEIDKYNVWNSHTWWFSVGVGELFMFPSSTNHQVETKKGSGTRISLAFNTFIKGKIGKKNSFTELIL